jgi:hypothetical protein
MADPRTTAEAQDKVRELRRLEADARRRGHMARARRHLLELHSAELELHRLTEDNA